MMKQEFSAVPTPLVIVWKLRNFSMVPKCKAESPMFEFLNSKWKLFLFHPRATRTSADQIQLQLFRFTPFVQGEKVKCKISCRDKFGKEYHTSEYVHIFTDHPNHRPIFLIKREDLYGELRDLLLPEDTLTFCCEMRKADPEEQEGAVTDSDGIAEWLNSEQEALSKALATVYDETLFPDVTLKVGGEDLPAHKAILSSRSSVFRCMFQADMKENQENVADIQEMEAQTARQMLRYVYTGKVCDLEDESAKSLYVAADRYDLPGLKARCLQYLLRNISVDNVCQLALLADLHSNEKLKSAVRLFIRKNHQSVLESANWKEAVAQNAAFFMELISSVLLNMDLVPKNRE